jgi:hypothetical protein
MPVTSRQPRRLSDADLERLVDNTYLSRNLKVNITADV